jgi:hypothetical protein
MVLLALTASGLAGARRLTQGSDTATWCGADAISDEDYAQLRSHSVSRLVYGLAGERPGVLAGAIETIEEHHPNQTVWEEKCA